MATIDKAIEKSRELGTVREEVKVLKDQRIKKMTIAELAKRYLGLLDELNRIKSVSVLEACIELPNVGNYIEQLEKENQILKRHLTTK